MTILLIVLIVLCILVAYMGYSWVREGSKADKRIQELLRQSAIRQSKVDAERAYIESLYGIDDHHRELRKRRENGKNNL